MKQRPFIAISILIDIGKKKEWIKESIPGQVGLKIRKNEFHCEGADRAQKENQECLFWEIVPANAVRIK